MDNTEEEYFQKVFSVKISVIRGVRVQKSR